MSKDRIIEIEKEPTESIYQSRTLEAELIFEERPRQKEGIKMQGRFMAEKLQTLRDEYELLINTLC